MRDNLSGAFGAKTVLFADAIGIVAGENFRLQGQQILGAALRSVDHIEHEDRILKEEEMRPFMRYF